MRTSLICLPCFALLQCNVIVEWLPVILVLLGLFSCNAATVIDSPLSSILPPASSDRYCQGASCHVAIIPALEQIHKCHKQQKRKHSSARTAFRKETLSLAFMAYHTWCLTEGPIPQFCSCPARSGTRASMCPDAMQPIWFFPHSSAPWCYSPICSFSPIFCFYQFHCRLNCSWAVTSGANDWWAAISNASQWLLSLIVLPTPPDPNSFWPLGVHAPLTPLICCSSTGWRISNALWPHPDRKCPSTHRQGDCWCFHRGQLGQYLPFLHQVTRYFAPVGKCTC